MSEPTCTRCGKCCHVLYNGKLIKCKNLVKLANGKTLCRNYHNRLGTYICERYVCGSRAGSAFDYPDCPFNCGKEIAPEWRK